MKIQDIVFIIFLGITVIAKKDSWSVVFGLICLVVSIPLFSLWVFFTAERLTWYAAAFFAISVFFRLRWQKGAEKI